MEFCDGGSLTKYLEDIREKGETIGELEVLKIMKEILLGVKACHEKKIFHRDLKPDNILRTKENIFKIIDFGFAKQVDRTT